MRQIICLGFVFSIFFFLPLPPAGTDRAVCISAYGAVATETSCVQPVKPHLCMRGMETVEVTGSHILVLRSFSLSWRSDARQMRLAVLRDGPHRWRLCRQLCWRTLTVLTNALRVNDMKRAVRFHFSQTWNQPGGPPDSFYCGTSFCIKVAYVFCTVKILVEYTLNKPLIILQCGPYL